MAEEIAIKIEILSQGAQSKLRETKKDTDKFSKSLVLMKNQTKENTKAEASLRGEQKLRAEQQRRLNYETEMAGKVAATYENSINRTTSALKRNKTNTGLNNAIIAESARLASDASYGYTAIANNLGQLISLLTDSARAAGGLGKAFTALLSIQSLFLIGIQLVITYGDDLYNFFTGTTKAARELTEAIKKSNEQLGAQRLELLNYIEVLKDNNIGEKERYNALKELETVVPGLTESNKNQKKSLEELTASVEDYIKQQRLRAELDAILDANAELFAERERVRVIQSKLDAAGERGDREEQMKIFQEELTFLEKVYVESDEARKAAGGEGFLERLRELAFGEVDPDFDPAAFFAAQSKDTVDAYDAAVARVLEIEKQLKADPNEDNGGSGLDARIKIFESGIFDLQKIEEKYRKNRLKNLQQTDQEVLEQTLLTSMTELDILEESFLRKEQNRLKNYKDDISKRDISDSEKLKLINDAEKKYNAVVVAYGEERVKVEERINAFVSSVRTKQARKTASASEKEYDSLLELQDKFNLSNVERMQSDLGANEEYYDAKEELLNEELKRQKRIAKMATEGSLVQTQALFEAASIEDQIRENQYKKEIQYLENKKAINMQYVNYTQGISSLLKNIAGENVAIQNAALVVEKGSAIAGVVVDAQAGISRSLSNNAAVPPFIPPGIPNPAKPLSTAAMIKEIAAIKTGSTIAIANILATTLTSFKKPSGNQASATTATTNVQAPAFNVVGPSTTDQLLTEVQGGLQNIDVVLNLNEVNDGLKTIQEIQVESSIS